MSTGGCAQSGVFFNPTDPNISFGGKGSTNKKKDPTLLS